MLVVPERECLPLREEVEHSNEKQEVFSHGGQDERAESRT